MKRHTQVINYRWTVLDATAAHLSHIIDIWATPYRVRPRDVEGGRHGFSLGLPGLASEGFRSSAVDMGYDVGDLVSFSLGLTIDPPSVARFFREGYEWVDVPEEVDTADKTIKDVMQACYELDAERFAHFDPKIVYTSWASAAAANWPEMMPKSAFEIPALLLNPYNYPWGDLAMLHFEYWENTDLRAALINDYVADGETEGVDWADVFMDIATGLGATIFWLLSNDPWIGVWGKLWPWMVPAEKDEHKLKKVLARKALRGVPIQALPTSPEDDGSSSAEGRTVTVVSLPPPRIELDGFGRQTIKPLRDPVPLLPGPFGRRLRASKLRFRITIPVSAKNTQIEIFRGDSLYYRETHQLGEFILPGVHIWSWDGYDKDDIFDSMALKGGDLSARLTVTDLKGRTAVATMPIATAPDKHRWTDVHIDPAEKQIDVTVFNQFLNPSDMTFFDLDLPVDNLSNLIDGGMGWLADKASPSGGAGMMGMVTSLLDAWPSDAGTQFDDLLEEFRGLFRTEGQGSHDEDDEDDESEAADGISQYLGLVPGMLNTGKLEVGDELGRIFGGGDLEQPIFDRLRTAVMTGIQRHWSRTVRIEGEDWTLTVNCKERAVDATRTYLSSSGGLIGAMRGSEAHRSFNLSLVEGLPTFNIWTDGKVLDDSHVERGWVTDVDADFAETGAHELGHQVLIERKDWLFSITHKGTSTIGQVRKPDSPFHLEEDVNGNVNWEIDVMYYHNADSTRPPETWQERTKGAEEDACVLISMGKVSFG